MTNEEEMELEPVIRRTETPSRSDRRGKSNIVIRLVKLTGRTISSLRGKIRDKKLDKAFEKYNKTYGKMRRALKNANEAKAEYKNGGDVTQTELFESYDIVNSYGKKLAKLGVKLLDADIKKAAAVAPAKRIKTPKSLLGKMRTIKNAIENHRKKKLAKLRAADMRDETKAFMISSLDSALFKDDDHDELRDVVNKQTIKDLKVGEGNSLDGLRRFISEDGKKSFLSDEELGRVERPVTDVPPVEPTPSVERPVPTVSEEDILGDLANRPEPVEEASTDAPVVQPRVTIDDMLAGLPKENVNPVPVNEHPVEEDVVVKEEPTPVVASTEPSVELTDDEQRLISRRKAEIAAIINISNSIAGLERQANRVASSEAREAINGYIAGLTAELDQIIANSGVTKNKNEEKDHEEIVYEAAETDKTAPEPETVHNLDVDNPTKEEPVAVAPVTEQTVETQEETQNIEPIMVAPAVDEQAKEEPVVEHAPEEEQEYEIKQYADGEIVREPVKKAGLEDVRIIEGVPADRVVQEEAPKAVRVESNFQDILARNSKARQAEESSMSQLEELKRERDLLLQKLEEDSLAREQRAQATMKEGEAITSQINEIRSFAEENGVDLGRRSK